MIAVTSVVAAYFLGSIPSGYLMARLRRIDIRNEGSGNIGATNALRVLGKPAGSVVLVMDIVKGWLAVAVLPGLVTRAAGGGQLPGDLEVYRVLSGLSVVLGHNYTCWLGFRGGKGIATSAGVLLALVPWALLVIVVVFFVGCGLSRYVSVGSIAASATLPVATICLGHSPMIIAVTAVMAVMAIYRHRSNIQRLRAGTERRLRFGMKEGTR